MDGLVSTRNTQAPQAGVGWGDFASSFVERRYTSCVTVPLSDLCWRTDNATISLNGRASELVALDLAGNRWRLKNDPGWLVERLHGAANGDNDGEYWKVTTTDGIQYFFGLGSRPGHRRR